MTFAAPLWLAGAASLSVGVVALHLLARRRPRSFVYPTARFIPDQRASAPAVDRRPSDLLLLLLRVAVILLIGTAFARPLPSPPRRTLRMVLLDRSRAVPHLMGDSTAALMHQAQLILVFDSTAHEWKASSGMGDTSEATPVGSLSAALLAAVRRAPGLATSGDSIALQIISPFATEEWDEATLAIRKLWRGRIDLILVPVAPQISPPAGGSDLANDDPLGATLALLGPESTRDARVVRTRPGAVDSSWAAAGGALVYWPREAIDAPWHTVFRDTAGGVFSDGRVVVAPFLRTVRPPDGTVIARWADGTPAATERPLGRGCERDVAIPTAIGGDLVLRHGMQALTRGLVGPCGGRRTFAPVADALLDSLRGPPSLVATSGLTPPTGGRVPASGWYLAAALVLFAAEPLLRRGRR
ncbi:MAG: BatA domain-containing protein [Gemmatimonadales bacterium]